MSRRSFLLGAAGLVAALAAPARGAPLDGTRRLRMVHTHTDEHMDVTYAEDGVLVPGALAELDRFLRDVRTGEVHAIDPGVLDIAWAVAERVGKPLGTFEVICGYRSPATNAMLHARSARVAKNSLHLRGMAIDLRLRGVPTLRLRQAALAVGGGGVGYYPTSDFVHVDTGRVRWW